MTKTTSKKREWNCMLALIPVFLAAFCVFSTKTIAQDETSAQQTTVSNTGQATNNPVMVISATQQDSRLAALLMDNTFATRYKEYNQILEKYMTEKDGRKIYSFGIIAKEDIDRLNSLFQDMSSDQRAVLTLTPQRSKVPETKIPSKEEFEAWKSPTEYGVWLDGKRIENSELSRYQASDFSLYYVSRLMRNAKNYGKNVYQLDLYTSTYYQAWKAKTDADETLYLKPNIRRANP